MTDMERLAEALCKTQQKVAKHEAWLKVQEQAIGVLRTEVALLVELLGHKTRSEETLRRDEVLRRKRSA